MHELRAPGSDVDSWHIAVRVFSTGQAIIRCQVAPLVPPIEWRSIPPEASLDAEMCTLCLALLGSARQDPESDEPVHCRQAGARARPAHEI